MSCSNRQIGWKSSCFIGGMIYILRVIIACVDGPMPSINGISGGSAQVGKCFNAIKTGKAIGKESGWRLVNMDEFTDAVFAADGILHF